MSDPLGAPGGSNQGAHDRNRHPTSTMAYRGCRLISPGWNGVLTDR